MKTTKIKPYRKNMITLAFVLLTIGLNAQSNDLSEEETSFATTIDNKDLNWLLPRFLSRLFLYNSSR